MTTSSQTVADMLFCNHFASLSISVVKKIEDQCPLSDIMASTADRTVQTFKAASISSLNGQVAEGLSVSGLPPHILDVATAYIYDELFAHTLPTTKSAFGWTVGQVQVLDLTNQFLSSTMLQNLDTLCKGLLAVNLEGAMLDDGLIFRRPNMKEERRPIPQSIKQLVRAKCFPKHPEMVILGTPGSPLGRRGVIYL